MTGRQLFERAKELELIPSNHFFDGSSPYVRKQWNQLAREATVDVAGALASSMQHERYRF